MKKGTLVVLGVVVVVLVPFGAWYFLDHHAAESDTSSAQGVNGADAAEATSTPQLPTPSLATIVSFQGGVLTLKSLSGTNSKVAVTASTLLYQNGAPISSVALKAGEMVAVILYQETASSSMPVAQTVTVVTSR